MVTSYQAYRIYIVSYDVTQFFGGGICYAPFSCTCRKDTWCFCNPSLWTMNVDTPDVFYGWFQFLKLPLGIPNQRFPHFLEGFLLAKDFPVLLEDVGFWIGKTTHFAKPSCLILGAGSAWKPRQGHSIHVLSTDAYNVRLSMDSDRKAWRVKGWKWLN